MDEEKRRAEEGEARESSLTLHVESIPATDVRRAARGHAPELMLTTTHPAAILYEVLLCLPTAPGLPLYKAETSVRLRFLGCSRTSRCLPVFDDVGYRM